MVIVEDERSTRDSLETLIRSADYDCIGYASGEAFLAAPLPPAPRCLLLDLRLGGQSGLEVQNALNAHAARLPIIFVSGDDNVSRAVSAMKAGALDYVEKPFDPELLLKRVGQAVQASLDGAEQPPSADHDAAMLANLTAREHEILALLVNGNINKEVAHTLNISPRTVETHRTHIMAKLEARTLADLARVWMNTQRHDPLTQP